MSLVLAGLLAVAAPPTALSPALPAQAPLILDRNRADREPAAAPARAVRPPALRSSVRVEAEAAAVVVRGISFDGSRVPVAVANAARRFIGQQATTATLTAIATAMSDAYEKTDIALYSVLVPRQSLVGGQVRIAVIEGFVEQVRFDGGETPLLRRYAAMLTAERPLTRTTFQRALSLIRDVPGLKADVQLLRGARPGGVILQVKAKRKRREVAFGFDNQGNGILGQSQLRAEAHAYGLFRDGDRTDLNALTSPDFRRLLYVSASHSTPIGDDGATLTGSVGDIRTRPRGSDVEGKALTFGLSAAYPLIRGYKKNLALTLGIDGVDSDAAVLGRTFSSDHTRAVRASAGYSDAGTRSVLTAGLTVSQGLDLLGARGMAGATDLHFTKVSGRVTLDRQVTGKLFAHLRASGQYSADRLAAAERFAVGGADFGRAFDQALLSGDKGAAGSAELGYRPLSGKLAASEFYGFVDGATVGIAARGLYRSARFDLASAGGGVRLGYGQRGTVSVEGARMIDRPYPAYRGDWRVNLAWRLALAGR